MLFCFGNVPLCFMGPWYLFSSFDFSVRRKFFNMLLILFSVKNNLLRNQGQFFSSGI